MFRYVNTNLDYLHFISTLSPRECAQLAIMMHKTIHKHDTMTMTKSNKQCRQVISRVNCGWLIGTLV